MNYKLDQKVYHKEVYNYREPLKVVGIRENELELEGDYSGGTHYGIGKSWLPIDGVSTVYDYSFKKDSRDFTLNMMNTFRKDSGYNIQDVEKLQEIVIKLTDNVK